MVEARLARETDGRFFSRSMGFQPMGCCTRQHEAKPHSAIAPARERRVRGVAEAIVEASWRSMRAAYREATGWKPVLRGQNEATAVWAEARTRRAPKCTKM